MRKLATLAAVAALLAVSAPAAAENNDPNIEFEKYKLDNGLEVVLHRDTSVPIVTVDVWYHVGSGDEAVGKSGFAHLFEHMLFQGSKNVGNDKHFEILKNIGATGVNGSTNTDRTNYFEVVPSHYLETALWLESDRMGYLLPLLTEESFRNQVDVVRNERRQNYDNRPYGKSWLELHRLMYPEGHPYRYTTIGRHEDLAAASLDDVVAFYKTWYVPANATLVIAGDFDTAEAKKLVNKWFGSFPKSTKPEHRTIGIPPMRTVRAKVEDPFAKIAMLQYAWHTPAFFAPGDAELDFVGHVLGSKTGRLYKRLVLQDQLAVSVSASQMSRGYSSIFMISVSLRQGADLAKVEAIINEELARITKEPISQAEFDRFVASTESSVVWSFERLLSRAETLQRYNHYVGDPGYLSKDLDRWRKSTPAKVRDVAAKYLHNDNRLELLTVPAAGGGASDASAAGGR